MKAAWGLVPAAVLFMLIVSICFLSPLYQENYERGYATGYADGYNTGYAEGLEDSIVRGYNIRDPSYFEAMQFTHYDRTDTHAYIEGQYECDDFAADFKNNAFRKGYRCGYVVIDFPDSRHAIVCFNTTDRGLVFIEPQDDDPGNLALGQHYWDREKYEVNYDDTIIAFIIAW